MGFTEYDLEDIGKVFVGGLSTSTNKGSLYDYFSQFGEVVDSVVMKNNETGRSRGFGFVTFKDPLCVDAILQKNDHKLDGKKIDPKVCTPRSMQKMRKQVGKCKIFLGGLPPDVTEEEIRSAFSKYGKVDNVVIMIDKETNKCRGFGFLSFELEESIEQACAERFVVINGKQVECKRAEPRTKDRRLSQSYDSDKNKNEFMGQVPYGQVSPVQQNSWNQAFYNLHGSPYHNYPITYINPNYNSAGLLSLNASVPGFTSMQSSPYMQSYATHYASYQYSPTSVSTYSQQPTYASSQVSESGVQNGGKSCDPLVPETQALTSNQASLKLPNIMQVSVGQPRLNDYALNASSYGLSKTSCVGRNDAAYSAHNATQASSYQRYHPYKL